MSSAKTALIALGIALVLAAGGTAVGAPLNDITPLVIAREAEAVGRAVRVLKKRPMPTRLLHTPTVTVVASIPQR